MDTVIGYLPTGLFNSLTFVTCSLLLYLTPRGRFILEKASSAESSVLSHVLFKSQVHCRAHNSPPLVPGVNLNNPAHIRSYFFKPRCNVILKCNSRTFKQSVSFRLEKRKISRRLYQPSLNNISTAGNCGKIFYFRLKVLIILN